MPQYRISELDSSTRIMLGLEMLQSIPERAWGRATELARSYGISRTTLYQLRDRAREGLMQAMAPRKPGPREEKRELKVDKKLLRRAITVLSLLKGSVRDIQLGLDLLFNIQRSAGYISETLQEMGAAAAYNAQVRIPLPVLGEADAIFQGRKPCLTVVDGHSFLVLNLCAAEKRDGTSWGLTLLDLVERGVQFHDLISDGERDPSWGRGGRIDCSLATRFVSPVAGCPQAQPAAGKGCLSSYAAGRTSPTGRARTASA